MTGSGGMWTVVEGEPRKHGGVYKWTEAEMSNLSQETNNFQFLVTRIYL